MRNILSILAQAAQAPRTPRFRDRRGFNASEITKDARDIYWAAIGEPETNASDFVGSLRMGLGSAIETYVVDLLKNSHLFGLRLIGSQVSVGGSDPVAVNGYLDGLVEDQAGNRYVVEIKTKWGWGAEFFSRDRDPGENYMAQMGYYLRDLSQKGITNQGVFLFVPFSDSTFGEIIAVFCAYDESTGLVTAYASQSTNEESARPLNITFDMNAALERLKNLEGYIERRELPPIDKLYKYPVNDETVWQMSYNDLKKAVAGQKVIGDWEISYSNWKNKHMELQGQDGTYSSEELSLLNEELSRKEAAKKAAANDKRRATLAAKKRSA